MTWAEEQLNTARLVVVALENGRIDDGVYEVVAVLRDGAGPSWGPYQMTLNSGGVWAVLDRYGRNCGPDAPGLASARELVKTLRGERWPDHGGASDPNAVQSALVRALSALGKLPEVRRAMDEVWAERYLHPAIEYAENIGITTALGLLVILDLFNQSGVPERLSGLLLRGDSYRSVGRIGRLRARFAESPPRNCGDEAAFIRALNLERGIWLSSHRKEAVRRSAYRVAVLADLIDRGLWDLPLPLPLSENMTGITLE